MASFLQLNIDLKALLLETKLLSFAWGGLCVFVCWYLLCSSMLGSFFILNLFFLFHSQQRIPQIWAAGVIGLSHILLHHQSLDMTTDWWWFQRLRVMTALSPYLWSHFAICLSSPFPSHHPAWQFKVKLSSAAARNIREPLTNQEWLTSTGRNAAVQRDAS